MTQLRNRETGQVRMAFEVDQEIRKHTSAPEVINYSDFGYDIVFPAPQPSFDPITQSVRETSPILTSKGHYEQAWEVIDLDAETIAANQQREKDSFNANIRNQIAAIEAGQARAVREAALSGDKTYLAKIEAQIAALRGQIK